MTSLENVKVGDKLVVHTHHAGYANTKEIATVDRLTATLVIAAGSRFNKKSGIKQGSDSWHSTWATPATPEEVERISNAVRRNNLIRACENIKFSGLLDKQMEMILEIANQNVD